MDGWMDNNNKTMFSNAGWQADHGQPGWAGPPTVASQCLVSGTLPIS